jgi:hypothetical protein
MKKNKDISPALLDAYVRAKKCLNTAPSMRVAYSGEILWIPVAMIDVDALRALLGFVEGEFELDYFEEDSLGFGIDAEGGCE